MDGLTIANISCWSSVPMLDIHSSFPGSRTGNAEFKTLSQVKTEQLGTGEKVLLRTGSLVLPCDHLDFESTVTANNDEYKGSFHSSSARCGERHEVAKKRSLYGYRLAR